MLCKTTQDNDPGGQSGPGRREQNTEHKSVVRLAAEQDKETWHSRGPAAEKVT